MIDLILIQSTTAFDAGRLREAIDRVFQDRNTHKCPVELPPPPSDWQVRYRTQAIELNFDPDIAVSFRLVSDFINPVLSSITRSAHWDPVQSAWRLLDDS